MLNPVKEERKINLTNDEQGNNCISVTRDVLNDSLQKLLNAPQQITLFKNNK